MVREDELLKKRICELAVRSYNNSQFVFTDFLSPSEISVILEIEKDIEYVPHDLYGGAEVCERQMLRFGSEEMFGYVENFPISCVVIEPVMKKFADDFSHRDFLGALMNLGIERSTLGDIFIKDQTAYVLCIDRIAEFICENLDKVKHTSVKCHIEKGMVEALKPELKREEVIVNSARIDAIVSKLWNVSRKASIELFREKKVFINGRVQENNSYSLKEDDVVSVRGYGKFVYIGGAQETRKGRIKVVVNKYV